MVRVVAMPLAATDVRVSTQYPRGSNRICEVERGIEEEDEEGRGEEGIGLVFSLEMGLVGNEVVVEIAGDRSDSLHVLSSRCIVSNKKPPTEDTIIDLNTRPG